LAERQPIAPSKPLSWPAARLGFAHQHPFGSGIGDSAFISLKNLQNHRICHVLM